jgi:FkbM family methyltransferase
MPETLARHPVFERFRPFEGWVEPGFEASFFGAKFRDWLFSGESKGLNTGRVERVGYPELNEEYFEWIALLSAVATASQQFRMFELGAGWGRWSAFAAQVCRQRGLAVHLVAVEPEPSHFEWLQMVFEDNALETGEYELWEAAVTTKGGTAALAGEDDPRREYGHYVPAGLRGYLRLLRARHASRKVTAVNLEAILDRHPVVDLIDMDIQGVEAQVLAAVPPAKLRGVRMIHVGTHSRKSESGVRKLFIRLGWHHAFSFPCYSASETPFGAVQFEDGVEAWINPAAQELLEMINAR